MNDKICVGCRVCELACSFHHAGAFSPELSSIKVTRDNLNGEIALSIDATCDLCVTEERALCVEHCVYGVLTEIESNEPR